MTYQYQLPGLSLGRVRDSCLTLSIIDSIDIERGQKSNLNREIANLPPANERVVEFQSITVRQIGKCYKTSPLIIVTMFITPKTDHIFIQQTWALHCSYGGGGGIHGDLIHHCNIVVLHYSYNQMQNLSKNLLMGGYLILAKEAC